MPAAAAGPRAPRSPAHMLCSGFRVALERRPHAGSAGAAARAPRSAKIARACRAAGPRVGCARGPARQRMRGSAARGARPERPLRCRHAPLPRVPAGYIEGSRPRAAARGGPRLVQRRERGLHARRGHEVRGVVQQHRADPGRQLRPARRLRLPPAPPQGMQPRPAARAGGGPRVCEQVQQQAT